MRSPTEFGIWDIQDEVDSTQTIAAEYLKSGAPVGCVFARHQTQGRGRFNRTWLSSPGDAIAMSLIFRDWADHPAPHLVGMTVACAAAAKIQSELQWPNDLVFGDRKVGGILTELPPDENGRRVPVVGVGINLNQKSFPPEISDRAISLSMYRGGTFDPEALAREIVDNLANMPNSETWADLSAVWMLFDHTPGKRYRLPDGSEGVAAGIGPEGQLLCQVGGEIRSVLAAEAIFGPQPAS